MYRIRIFRIEQMSSSLRGRQFPTSIITVFVGGNTVVALPFRGCLQDNTFYNSQLRTLFHLKRKIWLSGISDQSNAYVVANRLITQLSSNIFPCKS